MTDHDEREALRECPFCGGDAHWCPTYIDRDTPGTVECANGCGATVICYGSKAERIAAWNNRSLPAPAPAAGEAVAWAPKGHLQRYLKGKNTACWVYGSPTGPDDEPLYAVPQPPALGNEGLGELIAMLSAATPNELGGGDFDHSPEEIGVHVMEHYRAILSALANHSPDAGGVGEATTKGDRDDVSRNDLADIDHARLALFDAIGKIKIGNPTDDKLILDNLREAGFWICRLDTALRPVPRGEG